MKTKKISKFERAKRKAESYYFKKWKGNENITPAFGQKVLITRQDGIILLTLLTKELRPNR